MQAVHQGPGGFAGLHSPPGTGKTFTLAQMAGITLTEFMPFNSKNGCAIVMCAHSNQATQVLLEQLAKVLPKHGLHPHEEMVFVESGSASERRRKKQDKSDLDVLVESFALHQKRKTTAEKAPARFAPFLQHAGAVRRGKSLEKDERKAYDNSVQALDHIIRSTCRVFVCTVAMAAGSWFIMKVKKGSPAYVSRINCGMLAVDELSQCSWPGFLEV